MNVVESNSQIFYYISRFKRQSFGQLLPGKGKLSIKQAEIKSNYKASVKKLYSSLQKMKNDTIRVYRKQGQ